MNNGVEQPFSFTPQDVANALNRARDEVNGWAALLEDEQLKRTAESAVPLWKQKVAFLESTSQDDVVSMFHAVYKRILTLREENKTRREIGKLIVDEFPNITMVVDYPELDHVFDPTEMSVGQMLSIAVGDRT